MYKFIHNDKNVSNEIHYYQDSVFEKYNELLNLRKDDYIAFHNQIANTGFAFDFLHNGEFHKMNQQEINLYTAKQFGI